MTYNTKVTIERRPFLLSSGMEKHHFKQYEEATGHSRSLVIDDEPSILEYVAKMLTLFGFKEVETVKRKSEVIRKLTENPYDLFLTDLEMPDMNGFHLTQMVQKDVYDTKVVIMTGRLKDECLEMMTAEWVDGWLFKPFGFRDLRSTLRSLGLQSD